MKDVLSEIEKYKLLPVVTLHDEEEAVKVLGALGKGGLPMAEICFRTPYAPQALALAEKFPDMMFGAGTVLDAKSCTLALDAGAKFIVSPGLSEEVNAVCRERGVPYFPGIVTPTELMRALALGIGSVKFFPASDFGGVKAIRALSAAFPMVRFMPTGGVSLENIREYLSLSCVFACGGSWMVKGTETEIIEKTRAALAAAQGV